MYNTILKSTGSYGNYVIHISPTESKYFWKKKEATEYLKSLKALSGIPIKEVSSLTPTKNKYPKFY